MSKQIIKQPNGKFCLFSTVVDSVTHYDCTPEEIIEQMVEEQRKVITDKVNGVVKELNKGGTPYCQFTISYDEMIETIASVHGKQEAEYIRSTIEQGK